MRYLVSFLIGIGILTAAALADERQDRIDEARRALDVARDRLRDAERRADRARDNRENAIRDREHLGQQLAAANEEEGELTRLVPGIASEVTTARTAREAAQSAQDKTQSELKKTKTLRAESQKALDDYQKSALAAFMSQEDTKARLQSIEDAKAVVKGHEHLILTELATRPAYRELAQRADAAEAEVRKARDNPGDADALARASQTWIDSKSAKESAERAAFQADSKWQIARKELQAAEEAHASSLKQYEQRVQMDAQYARLRAKIDEVELYDEGLREQGVKAAEAIKAAERSLKTTAARQAELGQRLQTARVARDKLANQLVIAERTVRSAEADLASADRDIARAQREVTDAQRRLAQAQRG